MFLMPLSRLRLRRRRRRLRRPCKWNQCVLGRRSLCYRMQKPIASERIHEDMICEFWSAYICNGNDDNDVGDDGCSRDADGGYYDGIGKHRILFLWCISVQRIRPNCTVNEASSKHFWIYNERNGELAASVASSSTFRAFIYRAVSATRHNVSRRESGPVAERRSLGQNGDAIWSSARIRASNKWPEQYELRGHKCGALHVTFLTENWLLRMNFVAMWRWLIHMWLAW